MFRARMSGVPKAEAKRRIDYVLEHLGLAEKARAQSELSVTRSPLADADANDQLRDLVRQHLLSRDALIVRSSDAVRHGTPALTFLAKGGLEYVYLFCFVHGGNFFSIAWSALSPRTFRLGRRTVDEFIDRLNITP